MSVRVCFAYRWATYGGVERVFLNRAQAFRDAGLDVSVDVYYGADAGGLSPFRRAISTLGLDGQLNIVDQLEASRYDAVFVIDSPELISESERPTTRWIIECHTPYAQNRVYLDALAPIVHRVVVPSETFRRTVVAERPALDARLKLLRNCVSPRPDSGRVMLPAWRPQAALYFGRLDELKNPQGLLDLVQEHDKLGTERCAAVFLGPELAGYGMRERIEGAGLRGRAFQMPPLDFLNTGDFLAAWRRARGIMVSPSWGESFGLAAAESIAAGVPVLLSRLPEHMELVGGDERHLYDLNDASGGARKLQALFEGYDEASARMTTTAKRFDTSAFLEDWRVLLEDSCEKTVAA
ncbi:glycosyltransferase [Lysobacter claricitrinus]|uniref:glycosyltransferase n=1 Tax=Lysobacter claricitrinus TaxID=3367728 RepID=UPI0037DAB869